MTIIDSPPWVAPWWGDNDDTRLRFIHEVHEEPRRKNFKPWCSFVSFVEDYDDLNGNMLTKTDSLDATSNMTFEYDALNQMVRANQDSVTKGFYDYNAEGLRIRHRLSERGDVDYFYDGNAVIEERNAADNNLLAHYRYADRLLSLNTGTSSQYYHHDALGSTVNLTDNAGAVKVSYSLDPWGTIRNQTGTSVNRQIFTGQEYDENTGLIYFGARYYDPATGRFLSQDTYLGEYGTPPSLHRYLYAYSNPTVYVDPNGRSSLALEWGSGAIDLATLGELAVYGTGGAVVGVNLYLGYKHPEFAYGYKSAPMDADMFVVEDEPTQAKMTAEPENGAVIPPYKPVEVDTNPPAQQPAKVDKNPLIYPIDESPEFAIPPSKSESEEFVKGLPPFEGLTPEDKNLVEGPMRVERQDIESEPTQASELPIIKPGTEEWRNAVNQLSNLEKGKLNFRTETATDAEALLNEARGNMDRWKNYTDRKYKKGYETHNVQNPRELDAGNDLQHIKWKDGKSGGHIYYERAN